MFGRRFLASLDRTGAYGVLTAVFGVTNLETLRLLDAAVVGVVLADYVTWLVRSLALLPTYVLGGAYDACVNVLFGWILFHIVGLDYHLEGEAIAVAFIAFLAVAAVKVACYGVRFAEDLD